MCGISGIVGRGINRAKLDAMIASQRHRGPDAEGAFEDVEGGVMLGHNRLSIIDLSPAGRQPMTSADGRLTVVLNGEIYNYVELRAELDDYPFRTRTDTEVLLAAYDRWGDACLDRFLGMFAFLLWDARAQRLFAARDRFGVKPLHYHVAGDGTLFLASEIKALHAAEIPADPDPVAWATYLTSGLHDHSPRTFWRGVTRLPPGHVLQWKAGRVEISRWYDLAARIGHQLDSRPEAVVEEEYLALMHESVALRFRADVAVGINLSGGLDSSALLSTVQTMQDEGSDAVAFTFTTGDAAYDELPWVRQMLERTRHPLRICQLSPHDVPELAASVQAAEDEPFGGLPTLAYARLFEQARTERVTVLLDGQGMDEQWAGYDYYRAPPTAGAQPIVQGMIGAPTRPECLTPDFRALAEPLEMQPPFPDALRSLQYRDLRFTKIPRALRFNDRASMRSSIELREPFLDHRLVELAVRQPADRKIGADTGKRLLRQMLARTLPGGVVTAPKRPLQTPQREWLRGPLRGWTSACVETGLTHVGGSWLDGPRVRQSLGRYIEGGEESTFHIWQWINLGLSVNPRAAAVTPAIHA